MSIYDTQQFVLGHYKRQNASQKIVRKIRGTDSLVMFINTILLRFIMMHYYYVIDGLSFEQCAERDSYFAKSKQGIEFFPTMQRYNGSDSIPAWRERWADVGGEMR